MAVPAVEFEPFGGRSVVVRPARPDDLIAVGAMLARLSPESSRRRFFSPIARPRLRLVQPLVDVDHAQHETLVALCGEVVIGLAEYVRPGATPSEAEVAVVVDDGYQRHGVATFLFRALGHIAWERGITGFTAVSMPENTGALALARALSPGTEMVRDGTEVMMRVPLTRGRRPHSTPVAP